MKNHAVSHRTKSSLVIPVVFLAFAGILSTGLPPPANAIDFQKVPAPAIREKSPLFKLPDLIVSSVSEVPSYILPGSKIAVGDTTRNNGTTAAPSTQTKYYLSVDNTVGNDVYLGARPVPALGVGMENIWKGFFNVPSSIILGRSYYVIACADNTALVLEGNERNNCRFSTWAVKAGNSDLIVSFVSNPPERLVSGYIIQVADRTRNIGSIPTLKHTVTKYFYSTDKIVGNDVYFGERVVPAGLAVGSESSWTGSFYGGPTDNNSLRLITYYLLVCADGNSHEPETNERNNCLFSETMVYVPAM